MLDGARCLCTAYQKQDDRDQLAQKDHAKCGDHHGQIQNGVAQDHEIGHAVRPEDQAVAIAGRIQDLKRTRLLIVVSNHQSLNALELIGQEQTELVNALECVEDYGCTACVRGVKVHGVSAHNVLGTQCACKTTIGHFRTVIKEIAFADRAVNGIRKRGKIGQEEQTQANASVQTAVGDHLHVPRGQVRDLNGVHLRAGLFVKGLDLIVLSGSLNGCHRVLAKRLQECFVRFTVKLRGDHRRAKLAQIGNACILLSCKLYGKHGFLVESFQILIEGCRQLFTKLLRLTDGLSDHGFHLLAVALLLQCLQTVDLFLQILSVLGPSLQNGCDAVRMILGLVHTNVEVVNGSLIKILKARSGLPYERVDVGIGISGDGELVRIEKSLGHLDLNGGIVLANAQDLLQEHRRGRTCGKAELAFKIGGADAVAPYKDVDRRSEEGIGNIDLRNDLAIDRDLSFRIYGNVQNGFPKTEDVMSLRDAALYLNGFLEIVDLEGGRRNLGELFPSCVKRGIRGDVPRRANRRALAVDILLYKGSILIAGPVSEEDVSKIGGDRNALGIQCLVKDNGNRRGSNALGSTVSVQGDGVAVGLPIRLQGNCPGVLHREHLCGKLHLKCSLIKLLAVGQDRPSKEGISCTDRLREGYRIVIGVGVELLQKRLVLKRDRSVFRIVLAVPIVCDVILLGRPTGGQGNVAVILLGLNGNTGREKLLALNSLHRKEPALKGIANARGDGECGVLIENVLLRHRFAFLKGNGVIARIQIGGNGVLLGQIVTEYNVVAGHVGILDDLVQLGLQLCDLLNRIGNGNGDGSRLVIVCLVIDISAIAVGGAAVGSENLIAHAVVGQDLRAQALAKVIDLAGLEDTVQTNHTVSDSLPDRLQPNIAGVILLAERGTLCQLAAGGIALGWLVIVAEPSGQLVAVTNGIDDLRFGIVGMKADKTVTEIVILIAYIVDGVLLGSEFYVIDQISSDRAGEIGGGNACRIGPFHAIAGDGGHVCGKRVLRTLYQGIDLTVDYLTGILRANGQKDLSALHGIRDVYRDGIGRLLGCRSAKAKQSNCRQCQGRKKEQRKSELFGIRFEHCHVTSFIGSWRNRRLLR